MITAIVVIKRDGRWGARRFASQPQTSGNAYDKGAQLKAHNTDFAEMEIVASARRGPGTTGSIAFLACRLAHGPFVPTNGAAGRQFREADEGRLCKARAFEEETRHVAGEKGGSAAGRPKAPKARGCGGRNIGDAWMRMCDPACRKPPCFLLHTPTSLSLVSSLLGDVDDLPQEA